MPKRKTSKSGKRKGTRAGGNTRAGSAPAGSGAGVGSNSGGHDGSTTTTTTNSAAPAPAAAPASAPAPAPGRRASSHRHNHSHSHGASGGAGSGSDGKGAGAGSGAIVPAPAPAPAGGCGKPQQLPNSNENATSKLHTALVLHAQDECGCLPASAIPCDMCELETASRRCNKCPPHLRFLCPTCDKQVHSEVVKAPHSRLYWVDNDYWLPPLELCNAFPATEEGKRCNYCTNKLVKCNAPRRKGFVMFLTNQSVQVAPRQHYKCTGCNTDVPYGVTVDQCDWFPVTVPTANLRVYITTDLFTKFFYRQMADWTLSVETMVSELLVRVAPPSQPMCVRMRNSKCGISRVTLPPVRDIVSAYRIWREVFVLTQSTKSDSMLANCGLLLSSIDMVEA